MVAPDASKRDHLFISYAWEDAAVADWIVRRLTALGYRVWCDRFKLLGGERWPRDIDRAIKERTFRMIALLSKYSLDKPNPAKERQLALSLAKERSEAFLIPLNLDGLKSTAIGWELSDVTWIPFEHWATGLAQLVDALDAASTPRPLGRHGPEAAVATFAPPVAVTVPEERLISNCYRVTRVPSILRTYRASRRVASHEARHLVQVWPSYEIDEVTRIAFYDPPESAVPECDWMEINSTVWRDVPRTSEVRSEHIVTNLIRRSLLAKCVERGLLLAEDLQSAHFPEGLLAKDKLTHKSYTGRRVSLGVLGERKFGAKRFRYHLAVAFWLRSDMDATPIVELKVRLHVVDPANPNLDAKQANARRKKVTKAWWNHEWISRQLAIVEYLADSGDKIQIGPEKGPQVEVDARPIEALVTPGINDRRLEKLRKHLKAVNAAVASSEEDATEAVANPDDNES